MNERIKELAEQAGAYRIYDLDRPNDGPLLRLKHLGIEKFAELIVQECLMLVYDRQLRAPTDDDGYFKVALDTVSKDIERHFGVEEC